MGCWDPREDRPTGFLAKPPCHDRKFWKLFHKGLLKIWRTHGFNSSYNDHKCLKSRKTHMSPENQWLVQMYFLLKVRPFLVFFFFPSLQGFPTGQPLPSLVFMDGWKPKGKRMINPQLDLRSRFTTWMSRTGLRNGSMVIGSMGYFTPIYPIYK